MKRMTMHFRSPAWLWPWFLLLAAFGATCFGQAPITNGLVARWPGDGNAKDSTGHFDGEVSGGLRYVSGPAAAQAFQFDGGAAKVDFGPDAGNFGTRDFSVAFWIKTASRTPQEEFLGKRASCDAGGSFWDAILGSAQDPRGLPVGVLSFGFGAGDNRATYNVDSSHPINDGQWHHIVWVRQSTSSGSCSGLVYVDGALDNSRTYPETVDIANHSPLVMGHEVCECCDGARPYSGAAAELQLFSHALSAEEILALFKAGKTDQ
jgi:hypothetical protein